MSHTCWCLRGASKMSSERSISWTISSMRPGAQHAEPLVQPRQLGERPAEHDRHVVLAVGGELVLEIRGHVGRAPAEAHGVDVRGSLAQEAIDFAAAQAGVDDVRQPGGAW